VKIFLLFSEEYGKRLKDPSMYGNHRGIDPKLVPQIVERAHAAHLKVMAHVYTVPDFRVALAAGVDAIQHLPGIAYDPRLSLDHFVLTPADAAEAKRRGVTVTPTIYGLAELPQEDPKHAQLIRDRIAIPNLKLLKEAGVPLLLGSDHFRYSPLTELLTMRDLGVFSNRELLDIATRATTVDIFPERRLGRLQDGYEANFLVLEKDPLETLDNLRTISLRVKQGHRLTLPPESLARKSMACIED
jgi:imidazolonepropionase-like amidohydrolase